MGRDGPRWAEVGRGGPRWAEVGRDGPRLRIETAGQAHLVRAPPRAASAPGTALDTSHAPPANPRPAAPAGLSQGALRRAGVGPRGGAARHSRPRLLAARLSGAATRRRRDGGAAHETISWSRCEERLFTRLAVNRCGSRGASSSTPSSPSPRADGAPRPHSRPRRRGRAPSASRSPHTAPAAGQIASSPPSRAPPPPRPTPRRRCSTFTSTIARLPRPSPRCSLPTRGHRDAGRPSPQPPGSPQAEEEPLQPEPCSRPLKLLHSSHLGGISATSRLSLPQVLYGAFDALGGNQPLPARRTGPPSPSLPPAPLVGLTDFAFPDRGRRGKARRVPTGSAALLLHPCGGSSASSRVQP